MEYYKSFYAEALELSKTLPEEQSQLYKKYFIPLPLEKFASKMSEIDGGDSERALLERISKEMLDKLGIKFDAEIGSTLHSIRSKEFINVMDYKDLNEEHISNKMFRSQDDRLVAFVHAHSRNVVFINVPDNMRASLNLLFVNTDMPLSIQVLIRVGKNAGLDLFEWYASDTKETSLSAALHEIMIGEYSKSEINMIHNENAKTHVIGFSKGRVMGNGSLSLNYVYNGGLNTRSKNEINAEGYQTRNDVVEMVLGSGEQKFDLNTVIANIGVNTISDLESKAALMDGSVCLLKGFADVQTNAKGSLSFVNERGILLDKKAHMSSIPGMSIRNSNVKATHSSATAPVDEDSLFYLMSRGADEATSKKLLITGFFSKSIAKIRSPIVKSAVASLLNEKVNNKIFGLVPTRDTSGIWFDAGSQESTDIFAGHYKYRDIR